LLLDELVGGLLDELVGELLDELVEELFDELVGPREDRAGVELHGQRAACGDAHGSSRGTFSARVLLPEIARHQTWYLANFSARTHRAEYRDRGRAEPATFGAEQRRTRRCERCQA